MKKEALTAKAKEIFKAHDFKAVFMTSDGQGFTKENYAIDHARVLKDKEVTPFTRAVVEDNSAESSTIVENFDREAIVKRYEELFEKKAPHNAKTETLKERIEEKETLLERQAPNVEATTTEVKVEDHDKVDELTNKNE